MICWPASTSSSAVLPHGNWLPGCLTPNVTASVFDFYFCFSMNLTRDLPRKRQKFLDFSLLRKIRTHEKPQERRSEAYPLPSVPGKVASVGT
jgi:hypothetical protein